MSNELRESTGGSILAIQDVLRAIVSTLPDLETFAAAMRHESERTISMLLARSNSDRAIEAYRDFLIDFPGGSDEPGGRTSAGAG